MEHSRKTTKHRALWRVTAIFAGIAVNFLLALLAYRLELPLYLDTAGTIWVTFAAGTLPGIVTGVGTNLLCSTFNGSAFYYSFISALIAILSAWYFRRRKKGGAVQTLGFVLLLGLVSGVFGTVFQYVLVGKPQFALVSELSRRWSSGDLGAFLFAVLLNVVLNVLDKAVTVLLAFCALRLIPERITTTIRNSVWKQTPLSAEQAGLIARNRGKRSLSVRLNVTFIVVTLVCAGAMALISIELYNQNVKKEYTDNALHAAKLAALVVDPARVNDYIEHGEDAPGYTEMKRLLYSIRENSHGVKYLYGIQIRDDGCHIVFDLDSEDLPGTPPGDVWEFEEAFEPYLDELFAGEEIPAIESDDSYGWLLSAYYPVRDADGHTVCYIGADVSMTYLSDYVQSFIAKTVLIFSGLFVLILGYGLWVSRYYFIYPISSMTESTRSFAVGGDDPASLDRAVGEIQALDIRTHDEVEQLYRAICRMSEDIAEQVRRIRRYAETTAKMQNGLIITMVDMVESRDSDTGTHIQKTAEYVRIILDGLAEAGYYTEQLTAKFRSDTVMSAPLHDVGKINISDTILNKPGKLTEEEYAVMKTHTTAGKELLEKAISSVEGESYLTEARNMAAYHHERWDGKGYPEGLSGEQIPLSARIMAVADVFDALTSPRVYKPAFPLEQAEAILREGSGTQFDPRCVEVFLKHLDRAAEIMQKYAEK